MKNFSLILSFILVLFFAGCSQKMPTSPNNSITKNGNVSLSFDKTNAPKDATTIMAYLSRPNYDTLSGQLNILTDTSADISFNQVPVGTWHLKVSAMNSDNVAVYSGETDVQVNADFLTKVSLTLVPAGNGTGSIYIMVNWGHQSSPEWVDYINNPVLTNSVTSYGVNGVGNPYIIIENGVYKMWYKNLENNGYGSIGFAESSDGINWTIKGGGQVIAPTPGTWDEGMVTPGPVIIENGVYKMYYSGAQDPHQFGEVGLATSTDGIHWEKYAQPVLKPGSGWDYSINSTSLVKIEGKYYLYYYGFEAPDNFRVGLATSTDGINWTKYAGNPVLTPTQSWEGNGTYYASVIYENGKFKMVYMNYSPVDSTGFGIATSTDGIHWNKSINNPYFTGVNTANHWSARPLTPFLLNTGSSYRVYYNSTVTPMQDQAIGFLIINNF